MIGFGSQVVVTPFLDHVLGPVRQARLGAERLGDNEPWSSGGLKWPCLIGQG